MSKLIIQKYGGTSLGTIDRIKQVAQRIAKAQCSGKDLMIVVSAMAGETDKLLRMAREISDHPQSREIDLLLSSGERISASLLTIALNAIDCKAVSMTGRQIGLVTDSSHTRARIKHIDAHRARKVLNAGNVVVVAGFQGVNEQGDVTTLGRGGSDTSAVAMAVALEAERCEIYTDVDGVFTTDPNMVPEARKLDVVYYEEMLEMASLGAKVLQLRCVEVAKKYKMPLVVRSSYNDGKGTLICEEDSNMERPLVSGIMYQKNQSKITVKDVPDEPGIAAGIFDALAEAAISVDVIIQNVSAEGHADISFTLDTDHLPEAMKVLEGMSQQLGPENLIADSDIAKISIVGEGMRSHSGIAARMFRTLSDENINILMISTSEIRVSCIIEKKYTELAVRALHEAFGLKATTSMPDSNDSSQPGTKNKMKAL